MGDRMKFMVAFAIVVVAAGGGYWVYAGWERFNATQTATERATAERDQLDAQIREKCRATLANDASDEAKANRDWCKEKGYITFDERYTGETLSE